MAIARPIAFLAAFIALWGLLGVAAPTLTWAQTASGLPLDANGWTVFTPSANTQIIYVSSSTGNDSTGVIGDVNHPYKTIGKGLSRLRNGYPDWLLLKKGDVWTESNSISVSGRSATEPMVIGSYDPANPTVVNPGTGGARPIVNTPTTLAGNGFSASGSDGDYIAIVGIELYSSDRDPSNTSTISPFYNSSTLGIDFTGVKYLQQFHWSLIEDCKISFFGHNVVIEANMVPSASANLTLRRNVIVDAYLSGLSVGIFVARVNNVILEENLFDHNGWNETVVGGADPSNRAFSHNVYIAGFTPAQVSGGTSNPADLSVATARGNILANDALGNHFRSGGAVDNNLFVHNPAGFDFGAPIAGNNYITNNVVLEAISLTGVVPGWGIGTLSSVYNGDNYNVGTITFSNNILANAHQSTEGIFLWDSGFSNKATISNNIVFNWTLPIDLAGSSGITVTNNNIDASGTNNNPGGIAPSEPFPDPTRSVGSYAGTLGLTNTLTGFLAAARAQRKANWNTALMAAAVNNYIRAGFGITSGSPSPSPTPAPTPTPTSDTTPPSVPTGLAATAVSSTQVNLAWTASTDNVGVTGYKVFRNGAQVGTTSTITSYQDTGLSVGTSYTYTVSAYDAAGNTSAQSSSVSVTTPAPTAAPAPSVTINSPTNGTLVNGSLNIVVSATSANAIASIAITADGNPLATCAKVTSCSATWQKKKISKGTHVIGGIASSANGLVANSSVTVVVPR